MDIRAIAESGSSQWKGPFVVEKKIDEVTYRVKNSIRQPSRVYHIDKLALYFERNTPSWTTRYMRRYEDHCVGEVDEVSVLKEIGEVRSQF